MAPEFTVTTIGTHPWAALTRSVHRIRRRSPWVVFGLFGLVASACGSGAGGSQTSVTYVGVAGGHISFGTTAAPTGCNPNTVQGDTPGTRTVLAAVLPSSFWVGSGSTPVVFNSALLESAEPVDLSPQTIIYTINPKAVWSDGVPITAEDFKYAWQMQRGSPAVSSSDVASIQGYEDIESVTGSNGGHTVTVKFKRPFGDWKMLFDDLVPAHVMEKVGWSPSCTSVDPAIDVSGGPFKIASVSASAITLVQNPKWWGTPPNAHSLTVHIASSTAQLAKWMSSGYVQVAEPTTVTQSFLTEMTGLPGAQSDVDTSARLLQLDMASSLDGTLSPDLRVGIALSIDRQGLVDQQASWAAPSLAVANSHVYVQGQPDYTPSPGAGSTTTTIPPSTSSTSTTAIGAGGNVDFPVTPVPQQAAAFLEASGLVRPPGASYYRTAFNTPFELHLVYDASDPWASSAAPIIRDELEMSGLDTTTVPEEGATNTGQALAAGLADLALLAVTVTPYPSQLAAWYTTLLGPPGQNGSEDWTNYSSPHFDHLVQTASRQLNSTKAVAYYNQADTMLWDDMVSLPLYAEPYALVWSRTVGGVTPQPLSDSLLWFAQLWSVRVAESTDNTTPPLPGQ